MIVNRNLTPEEYGDSLRSAPVFKDATCVGDALGVLGAEEHGYTVVALVRQQMATFLCLLTEEPMRNLEEDACPVTSICLKTFATAMLEIDEYTEGVIHHTVRSLTLEMRKRPDATGIMLKLWPIQAACLGLLHVRLLACLATMAARCQ
jgi:hypothetical protein